MATKRAHSAAKVPTTVNAVVGLFLFVSVAPWWSIVLLSKGPVSVKVVLGDIVSFFHDWKGGIVGLGTLDNQI
jgi:hypothetical protein